MMNFWNRIYFGNSTQDWLTAVITLIAALVAIYFIKRLLIVRLKLWTVKTKTDLDDFLIGVTERSVVPLLYLGAVYFSIRTLTISATADKIVHVAYLFTFTFFVLRIMSAVVREAIFSFIKSKTNKQEKQKEAKGLLIIINIVIWMLGIVFLIDNLGYDVTTIIAGLGIGGIAIALAAQTILGDLFSYFVIFFDRPFEIGDFIVVEDKPGTVEYIGIKTTRLRTLSGEQLICSNTYLTNSRVHNFKRMEERRIAFKLGVTYQTPQAKLRRLPGIVKAIIEAQIDVRFDRGHFSNFGDFSLDFDFVYYVLDPDFNLYMDKQQDIYLNIAEAFEREGIDFAYPTQSLFMEKAEVTLSNGRVAERMS